MIGDSQSLWDGLGRGGCAVRAAVSFVALALSGCALSYEDDEGRRQVIGLFSMSSETDAATDAFAETVHHFTFYGLWLDDAFRGPSIALGEVELSVADLRNRWAEEGAATDDAAADACEGGFGFRWCSLAPRDADRAGAALDIAVAGISLGAGENGRHFGIGYHRQVLLEVTNENALVTWPAHVGIESLLRGSFNG
jgi:hypothetical protein